MQFFCSNNVSNFSCLHLWYINTNYNKQYERLQVMKSIKYIGASSLQNYSIRLQGARVLCLWCLMPLSTVFQLYRGGQFYWWRKPEYLAKTTDLSKVTDKLISYNVVSSTPRLSGILTHNFNGDRH